MPERTPPRSTFLSIVTWPDGWQREDVARLLGESGAMDFATARLKLGQAPPMALGFVEPRGAQRTVDELLKHGGDGFVFQLADLTAPGAVMKIRGMEIAGGDLHVDIWRGPSTVIHPDQIQILVRAHLVDTSDMDAATKAAHRTAARIQGVMPSISASYNVGMQMRTMANLEHYAAMDKRIQTSDKLDIHTTNGLIYQIDGDKFGFGVLGELRGHSDKANMDKMTELFTHLAPDPIVDTFFSLWRPPQGYDRLRLPGRKLEEEDPAFAFYSRWAALTYRHVMGTRG